MNHVILLIEKIPSFLRTKYFIKCMLFIDVKPYKNAMSKHYKYICLVLRT